MNKVYPEEYNHKIDILLEPNTQLKVEYFKHNENENIDNECLELFRCICCFCLLFCDFLEGWFISFYNKCKI